MPSTSIRYTLDPTGVSSDNLVVGEIHTLNTARYRALAPTYGAFFTESLVVRDNLNNRVLEKGIDYQCTELLQEATLLYGKEISMIIIIINENVSSEVRVNYQVLGGLYQNPAESVKNAYENLNLDSPIDWLNVINKPTEYPPGNHNHLLSEVYGFEALTIQLERIRNAIVLSNQPALEAIVEWVKGYAATSSSVLDAVTAQEISDMAGNDKAVTFNRLLQAMKELHFNTLFVNPSKTMINNGETINVGLVSTNLDDGTSLYWTVEHITTDNLDFNTLNGQVTMIGNEGSFNLSLAPVKDILDGEKEESFRIAIRKNSVTGPIMVVSKILKTVFVQPILDIDDYLNTCCLYNPSTDINPDSYYIITTKKG